MPDIRSENRNQVDQRGAPGGGLQAGNFGREQVGGAVASFGGQVSSAASDLELINEVHDEAAVKEADTEVLKRVAEERRRVLSLRGGQAITASGDFKEVSEKIRKEALGRLTNDRQRRIFSETFDRRIISDQDTVDKYANAETLTYMVDASNARLDALATEAVDKYDDPEERTELLRSMASEIETVGRLQGDSEDRINLAKKRALSTFHAQVADTIGDPLEKEAYIDKNAGEILPKEESEIRRANRPARDEAQADTRFSQLLQSYEEDATAEGEPNPDTQPEDGSKPVPDPKVVARRTKANADPLRGRGSGGGPEQQFHSSRARGRKHRAKDLAAPEGTPVYPPIYGKVIEVDTTGETDAGYFVKVKHPDGRVTSYSHLRNVSVGVGDEVFADTALGGVGRTGKNGRASYGSHLHFVVRNARGERVDPDKQKWETDGSGFPDSGKYRPKYDGTQVNVEQLYEMARIRAVEEQWSPTEVRAVFARIDEHAARQDKVQDRRFEGEAEAASEAYTAIIEGGGTLTNPAKQIPNFGKLDADTRRRYLEKAEANNAAAEAAEAARRAEAQRALRTSDQGIDRYTDIFEMSQDPTRQGDFAELNLAAQRPFMTDAQYTELLKKQKQINNRGGDINTLQATNDQVNSAFRSVFPELGFKGNRHKEAGTEERKRAVFIQSQISKLIDQNQEVLGRRLNDQEIKSLVLQPLLQDVYIWEDNLVFRDRYANDEGEAIPLVEARRRVKSGEEIEFIPAKEYNQIVSALRNKDPYGTITEDMVRDVYNQRKQ